MARGTGNKRGPRQAFQQVRQQQPQQPPQHQQYQQPIMIPHLSSQPQQIYHQGGTGQQQIMLQQVQMPLRMQQQATQPQLQRPSQQQYHQPMMISQIQQTPPQYHTNTQNVVVRSPQMMVQPVQMPIRMIQQQHQAQSNRNAIKKQAIEPNNFVLTEQSLLEPFLTTLQRNAGKHYLSHTLHRTFGPVVAQIIQ